MEQQNQKIVSAPENKIFNKDSISPMLWSVGISLYWVVFIWGFWQKGIFALGINAAVFLFLVLGLFNTIYPQQNLFQRKNASWLIPLFLILLSFLIYENPFIKLFNLLVYPVLFITFYNYAQMENRVKWDFNFFLALVERVFQFFRHIGSAASLYGKAVFPAEKGKKAIIKKIIIGLLLFLVIAVTVIIPLLSSADKIFAQRIDFIYTWLKEIISTTTISKFIVFYLMSVVFLSYALVWKNPFTYENKESEKNIDSIISGIVIGGILLLYVLFLIVQARYLWIKELPLDFHATETMVKSGFWQLLFLSLINIAIFFTSFKKTNSLVQRILAAFTFASFLLLASAAYRMALYVGFYGFSYEKFYASYAVLFCGILLIWLFLRLFRKEKTDIIKFVAFLFLWMYAIVTIIPAEQFIARANVYLSKRHDSRINLYELSMLSADVLNYIKDHKNTDLAYSQNQDPQDVNNLEPIDWNPWIKEKEDMVENKKWYEMNLSNAIIIVKDGR